MQFGMVSYLNALPFCLPFRLKKLSTETKLSYAIPRILQTQLENKHLDGALCSAEISFNPAYSILPDFCIAGGGKILSVNLYTKCGIENLTGAQIGLTNHSLTSISLLKVLCHHFWKVTPCFIPLENPYTTYDAFLLIGNEALAHQHVRGFQTIDLARAWYHHTHLPFVFALFTFQKNVATEMFHKDISQAYAWSCEHQDLVIEEAHRTTQLSKELIRIYYQTCSYTFDAKKQQALETFKRLLHDVPKTSP